MRHKKCGSIYFFFFHHFPFSFLRLFYLTASINHSFDLFCFSFWVYDENSNNETVWHRCGKQKPAEIIHYIKDGTAECLSKGNQIKAIQSLPLCRRNRMPVPISNRKCQPIDSFSIIFRNDFIMSFIFKSPDLMVIYWFSLCFSLVFRFLCVGLTSQHHTFGECIAAAQ